MNKAEKTEGEYTIFPEEYSRRKLNSLYREIPLKDTTSRLLRKYFNAAANLYGIIPLKKLYEIIVSQNRNPVSEEAFRAFAEIAKHECEDYIILGEQDIYEDGKETDLMDYEVIDVSLVPGNTDDYISLKELQQGKPYYIPDKKIFLAYDDSLYMEPSREYAAMRDFLLSLMRRDEDLLDDILTSLSLGIRYEYEGLADALEFLEQLGLPLEREEDLQKFVELYQSFHNNTRMPCNRGYTPYELHSMTPPESRTLKSLSFGPNIRKAVAEGKLSADELRQQILIMDLPNEAIRIGLLKELSDMTAVQGTSKKEKIGRNDPCPCGSGKKYKKCCGR